ncbi:hypothetical protein UFOVP373_16 [uncultured Caudovirales phage]|uniref:Uncharacterized protein n=1 Tax=uncultured Caudovirales phage TaxID=2100421 RepID=A0A6J7WXR9_9CAUD|nr:hypothetical protein UFOVP373_16 [uncultured Caudovirales phage]
MADELERALLLRDLELMGQPRNPNAVQPGRAGLLDVGVGLPERLSLLNQIFNPVEAIGQSMNAGERMMSPNMGVMDRLAALGDMASGIAGVVAPVAAASRAGTPAATALMEGLLGGSPTQQAAADMARRFGADETGSLPGMGGGRPSLDVSRRDASNIFGAGSERVRYTDPQSGGTIEVVVRPDGSASVLELEVPEASRGQGIGQTLQERVMQDFPMMGGQVSSKAAATTAYRLGRRPPGKPYATLEEVFADINEMSSVNMVSPAMQERLTPSAPSLPTPRTDAEAMARDILQLRAEGRAGEVTDQMRAAADPQYMYFNTPLPMDAASRMARAAGRRDEFHGTTTGSDMTYADAFRGSGTRQGIGFVTSDNPYVSSSYADPQFGSVFPMLNQPIPENAPRLDLGGSIWSEIPEDLPVALGDRTVPARQIAAGPADVGGVFSTNQISRGASFDYPSVEFSNILDRSIHAPRPRTDDGMDIMREFQRLSSEPSTVTMRHDTRGMRSRFALFDPEFAHLRNLSASLASAGVPLGLLAMSPEEEQY